MNKAENSGAARRFPRRLLDTGDYKAQGITVDRSNILASKYYDARSAYVGTIGQGQIG